MLMQIREGNEKTVQTQVISAIVKASEAMQINLSDSAIKIITEDLIDMYQYESIQDIIECLKQGRRGVYGVNSYGKLNLELISKWMQIYLDGKYLAKENHEKIKQSLIEKDNDFDAEEFYRKGKEYIEAQKELNKKGNQFSNATYNEIKHQYLKEKKDKKNIDNNIPS